MHLQVRCSRTSRTRSTRKHQSYASRKWTVESVSAGGNKLFNTDAEFQTAKKANLCVVLPVSVSYFEDEVPVCSHDIGFIYIKSSKHLLTFDSLGMLDNYHASAIRQISGYVTGVFVKSRLPVLEQIFVVKAKWQPEKDMLCVIDVWHFFWLFASEVKQQRLPEECTAKILEYYRNSRNVSARFETLKVWYEEAIQSYDPRSENVQPISPEPRSNLPSQTGSVTTPRVIKRKRLWELNLDTTDPYSRLTCRRKSCPYNKMASRHRKMYTYIL